MISKALFEHFNEIGHSYEGPIEGGGFSISEPIIVPHREYGCDETFLEVHNLTLSSEYIPSSTPPSTDVRMNKDGTYSVVGAKNDGDNNIYVVDENGKRTGETIGQTLRPYDFLNTDDGTGEFTTHADATINLKDLTVSGKVNGTNETIKNADRVALLEWGYKYFRELLSKHWTSYWSQGARGVLAYYSRNGGPLDLKVSLGLNKYQPISVGQKGPDGKPIITTLRGVGNELFGYNLRSTISIGFEIVSPKTFYKINMKVIGAYNQHQNNGNGYNEGYPYYGEHTYSGSYIYLGYWRSFYE